MSFEKKGTTGLLMADPDIKIGIIYEEGLEPDFREVLRPSSASYQDHESNEHLFSAQDLDHISEELEFECPARGQLIEVLSFMSEREIDYVLFRPEIVT